MCENGHRLCVNIVASYIRDEQPWILVSVGMGWAVLAPIPRGYQGMMVFLTIHSVSAWKREWRQKTARDRAEGSKQNCRVWARSESSEEQQQEEVVVTGTCGHALEELWRMSEKPHPSISLSSKREQRLRAAGKVPEWERKDARGGG